ncbi:MAG: hypothetical protein QNL05_04335 [Gammaproteobacteria bacterium]|nr:hypothetical protein [Gammaproteobacteria bacterium]
MKQLMRKVLISLTRQFAVGNVPAGINLHVGIGIELRHLAGQIAIAFGARMHHGRLRTTTERIYEHLESLLGVERIVIDVGISRRLETLCLIIPGNSAKPVLNTQLDRVRDQPGVLLLGLRIFQENAKVLDWPSLGPGRQ